MAEAAGVAYLRTFPDFEQGNVSASAALGLDRVLALLEEVGSPHLRLPVAHIAGTKGKGSTSAAWNPLSGPPVIALDSSHNHTCCESTSALPWTANG